MTGYETLADQLADPTREASLIAAAVADPRLAARLADELAAAAFTDPAYAAAYAALVAGDPVPPGLDLGPADPDPIGAAHRLATLAAGRAGVRRLEGFPAAFRDVLEGTGEAAALGQVLATAAEAIAAAGAVAQPLTPSAALLEGVLADLAHRADLRARTGSAILGLCTGFPTLDDKLGGLEGGTVTLLAARPNIGKTTLANQWAYTAARAGAPVLYLSYENPPADLVRKHLTRLAQVPALDALRGKASPDKLAAAAVTYRDQVGDRLYFAAATAATDTATIRELAGRVARRHPGTGPVLIVVDYLQKLAQAKSGDGRRAGLDDLRGQVGRCVQELRDLAADLRAPVLAVATVNRQAYADGKARPGMASLKESGDLEYAADAVLLLGDETDGLDGADKGAKAIPPPPGVRPVWLTVAKNRYGPTGAVPLIFHEAQGRFEERERPVAVTSFPSFAGGAR